MAKTVLQLINNVLALVGEQPLTSSSGNVGLLVRNALETALINVAQESRANIFETQISAAVTADDYMVPAATLATNILQVYSVSVRSSYGSTYGDNLSKLEYLPLDSLMNEPAYSIVGQNLYISPTVARPLTLHIIALQAPTLPASDSADCGLPDALIGYVSHSAAAIIALSYLDDPNQASVHANLSQQLGDKLKSQYGNTRAKSFNLSGQRSTHRFASVAPLPSSYGRATKVNTGVVVWVDDVDIDDAFTTALALDNTDLLFNRKTEVLYKYNGNAWAEYTPDSEFAFVNKYTGTLFKFTNAWETNSGIIYAKDWGAVGDNRDDTDALQAAIDYALTNGGIGEVHFSPGDYWFNIVLPNNGTTIGYNTISLIGSGTNATFIRSFTSTGYAITYSSFDNWQFPRIENLSIYGNDSLTKNGVTFDNKFSGGVCFNNVNFRSLDKAVHKPFGNIGCKFNDCSFYGCNYHYFASSVADMHAGNDTFNACHFQGAALASVYINSPLPGTGQTVFNECVWELNPGFPIFVENYSSTNQWTPGFKLNDCWFEQNATAVSVTIESVAYAPKTCYLKYVFATASNLMIRSWQLDHATLLIENCGSSETISDTITLDAHSSIVAKNFSANPGNSGSAHRSILAETIVSTSAGTRDLLTIPRTQVIYEHPGLVYTETFANNDTYAFTGTGATNAVTVNDGVLFAQCAELTVNNGNDLFGTLFNLPTNKYVVWTLDIKQTSGDAIVVQMPFVNANLSNTTDKWQSLAGVINMNGVGTFGTALNITKVTSGSGTLRLSAFQVMAFDTFEEANRYLVNGYFCAQDKLPRVLYSDAVFTTGTWRRGDIIYNTAPTAGGFIGWVCTSSGSPGTWRTFGVIS